MLAERYADCDAVVQAYMMEKNVIAFCIASCCDDINDDDTLMFLLFGLITI